MTTYTCDRCKRKNLTDMQRDVFCLQTSNEDYLWSGDLCEKCQKQILKVLHGQLVQGEK